MLPILAAAQVNEVGIFADATLNDCNIVDDGSVVTVYVFHVGETPAAVVDFMLQNGLGFNGTWISDTRPWSGTFGTSQTGVTIIYNGCVAPPTLLMSVTYQTFNNSTPCSFIEAVPNPNVLPTPALQILDCTGTAIPVTSKNLIVNPDGICDCVVPTETVTWGRIKAIYGSE